MIVVTAPTGQIGRQLIDLLLSAGEPVRVIARDPSRLSPQVRARVEVVAGSHGDRDVVDRAFTGADAVFWLVPPDYRTESLAAAYLDFTRPACEAIVARGVRRVVGVSALGRGVTGKAGLVSASLAMDDLIASTGVAYRALAMPSFMDNLLRDAESIAGRGVFSGMALGDRKVPACATRDIAAVAAGLLRDTTWTGNEDVPVLGPEDLTMHEMARIMSEVLGRPVRYEEVPAETFRAGLLAHGMSAAMAEGMVEMMAAKNAGLDNAAPRTPGSSTPTTFRQWCEEVLKPAVEGVGARP
ncbi:NmrA family NAD(P)-binding protein [Actinomadura litoris]|uniref:NmrA family NAD(P)-binding protein n=1 Tax=Actinomadura litoris TaxID=2678616 RepID=UPI001FA6F07B|nr:NAD(P)H-binding protein [Actinomadura litoris]